MAWTACCPASWSISSGRASIPATAWPSIRRSRFRQTSSRRSCDSATLLAQRLEVRGLMNIQFVVDSETDTAQVLEVNPRASRTVPYLSKITGIPMVKVATSVMLGQTLKEQGYASACIRIRAALR